MSEQQESPTPAEVRKAEAIMTPLQKLMTKARFEIMSHMKDFQDVGIDEEEVLQAAEKASARVEVEYEQRREGDILERLLRVVNETAETPNEKKISQLMAEKMERLREDWEKIAKQASLVSESHMARGVSWADRIIAEASLRRLVPIFGHPCRVDHSGLYPEKTRAYVGFPILETVYDPAEKKSILPSDEFLVRVLKGLGILETDGKLADLRLKYGERNYGSEPHCGHGGPLRAYNIPSEDFPGVDFTIEELGGCVTAFLNSSVLEKTIELPKP